MSAGAPTAVNDFRSCQVPGIDRIRDGPCLDPSTILCLHPAPPTMWKHTCPPDFSDHTFATKHGVSLDLRVWPAGQSSTSPSSPWILYVHGGAFCGGKHYLPNAWVVPAFRPRGYHVVSIAYRFAPFAGLEEMKQDGVDGSEWCRTHLPRLLDGQIDVDRCVLVGESAGGTIVSLLAHVLSPKPKAVVNIYGPTDFLDPHYSPSTPPNSVDVQPLTDKWTEEDCRLGILSRDLTRAITVCPYVFDVPIQQVRDQWSAPRFEYTEAQRFNWEIKRYMRTNKLLFKVILRTDQLESTDKEMEVFKASSPYHMLDKTGAEYPPTWFLHGEADMVVPIQQARRMQARLQELGVETGTSYEPGEGHEFDNKYTVGRVIPPSVF